MKTARSKSTPAIHVVLAYDTARTRGAIFNLLGRISERLHNKRLFNVNSFKFGLLPKMNSARWSAGNPAEAELAVVAFGETNTPGADFLRWLDGWAKRHAGKNAALGLLPMGAVTGRSVERVVRELKKIASRHGLGFIYNEDSGVLSLHDAFTAPA